MNHGRVLYVEDAEPDRVLMKSAFQSAAPSLTLNIVPDGEEAVSYLAGQGPYSDRETYPLPDLVLLDLKLPGMSGHEVLERIRRQPAFQTLPVAVLTSSPQAADITKACALGANLYLVKPLKFDRLKEVVRVLESSLREISGKFDALRALPECQASV